LPGAIHDQELVLEEKRLCNYGTDAARSEQAGQDSDDVDEENDQIAHRRMVAGREILRDHGGITVRQRQVPDGGLPVVGSGSMAAKLSMPISIVGLLQNLQRRIPDRGLVVRGIKKD
jgi:hypothetical protein